MEPQETTKQRKVNVEYTLGIMQKYIKIVIEEELVNEEKGKELKKIYKSMTKRWIGIKMEI